MWLTIFSKGYLVPLLSEKWHMKSRCKTLESYVTQFTYLYLSESNLLQKKMIKSQLKWVNFKKCRFGSKYVVSIPKQACLLQMKQICLKKIIFNTEDNLVSSFRHLSFKSNVKQSISMEHSTQQTTSYSILEYRNILSF